MDWTDFKKSFTQKQEDALWQYFIDHSRIQPNGYYGIMFYVKNVDDFWRRVYARYSGDFHRYEIEEKAAISEKYMHLKSQAKKGEVWDCYDSLMQASRFGFLWRFLIKIAKRKHKDYVKKK